jgi:hypothetical protein
MQLPTMLSGVSAIDLNNYLKMKSKIDHIIKLLPLLPLVLFLFMCSTDDCLHNTGAMTTNRIETGYFKTVTINGIFDIFLVQDTACFVEFSGGSKVLDYTQAQNSDSALFLNNTNSCYFLRQYKKIIVYLHFKDIQALYLHDPCSIKTTNAIKGNMLMAVGSPLAEVDVELDNDNFFFYTNKSTGGTYIFRGKCTNCTIWGYYASKIDATNLQTKTMNIKNFSIADYYVNVEEKLNVEIYNNGNVIYYGSPVVQIDSITGSGRVIKGNNN